MTDAGRRRIDVSSEVHSRLDAESKRRNIPIRDPRRTGGHHHVRREAQAALSVRQQRERRHADRMENRPLKSARSRAASRPDRPANEGSARRVERRLRRDQDDHQGDRRDRTSPRHDRQVPEAEFTTIFKEAQSALAASVLNVTKAAEERAKSLGKQLDRIEKRQSGTRTKLGAGAALGIAGLVLICLLFANTAPTRWLSIRLLGESDSASAAWSLAGDGRTKGELMAETKGLLGDDTYRVRYAECVDHAKRMKKPFRAAHLSASARHDAVTVRPNSIAGGGDAAGYYAADNYYTGEQEGPSEWGGGRGTRSVRHRECRKIRRGAGRQTAQRGRYCERGQWRAGRGSS
jgi:hypothetical protein